MVSYFRSLGFQVQVFRSLTNMPYDIVRVNCDAESIKGFVTYLKRRHTGATRRDPYPYLYEIILFIDESIGGCANKI